jgi:hypothetical protein
MDFPSSSGRKVGTRGAPILLDPVHQAIPDLQSTEVFLNFFGAADPSLLNFLVLYTPS